MPYAARPPPAGEAPPTSSKGDVGGGFWCDCLPFACTATLTVAVTTLDVITDWLLYRAFLDVAFGDRLEAALSQPGFNETQPTVWFNRAIYRRLPLLLQVFCLLGVVVYSLDLFWMSWMFTTERRKFKDKRDGLPYKGSAIEKHGSDIFIFLHVTLHDLPLAALLLAAQLAVSCRLVLPFGHVIFYIAMMTTLVSVSWKLLQLVYNSGCLDQREEYICTPVSWLIRSISSILLAGALAAAGLNVALLTGWRGQEVTSILSPQMMEKIRLDSWLREDSVFLTIDGALSIASPVTEDTDSANDSVVWVQLAGMADIFAAARKGLKVEMPCEDDSVSLTLALVANSQFGQNFNCSATFMFRVSPQEGVLYFDFLFRSYDITNGACLYMRGPQTAPHIKGIKDGASQPKRPGALVVHDKYSKKVIVKTSTDYASTSIPAISAGSTASSYNGPLATSEIPVVDDYDDISMATQLSENVRMVISRSSKVKCLYSLVQNSSLLSGNPCD